MPAFTQPQTVCILGFHRSGTSLAARVIHVLGVQLGDDLLPAHETDNPRGYWEPRWMNELNDELLAALGTTWWQPFPGQPGWHESPTLGPLRERASAQYAEQLGDAALSGWKDPRSTLTLAFWQALAPDPAYVVCVRNPIDAIASIQRRPEPTLPTAEWGELWLEYTARALQGSAGSPRVVLFYDDWFEDPRGQVAALAKPLGVAPDDPRVAEAEALVQSDMRHHRSSPMDLAGAPGLSAPARTVYLALRAAHQLCRSAEDSDDEVPRIADAIERVAVDAWQASRDAVAMRQRAAHLDGLSHQRGEQLEALRRESDEQLAAERGRADAAECALADAQAEIHRLQQHARTLEGSLSWRLTAPLRALMRLARRARP